MRWPWKRNTRCDTLVFSWSDRKLSFVLVRPKAKQVHEVLQIGVLEHHSDSTDGVVKKLEALGLRGYHAMAMLRPEQYQFLQVAAPAVTDEELKAAARYQIRDMLDTHLDEVTLDILRVGDTPKKANPQLFVVAAPNPHIQQILTLADALQWRTSVIDILETAQRNLQFARPLSGPPFLRARGLLMLTSLTQAMLTISANGELYFARRLELPVGFIDAVRSSGVKNSTASQFEIASGTAHLPNLQDDDRAQRVLLEVQRTLDSWDRTWNELPLAGLQVYAADRSPDLAAWLGRGLGQVVTVMEPPGHFAGLNKASPLEQMACLPLIGVLLRTIPPSN